MPKSSNQSPVKVGGQAVIEGVMMANGGVASLAVRRPDGEIHVSVERRTLLKDRHPFLGLPLIRGIVTFFESMTSAYKYLMQSAELAGQGEETEPSKFEKWLIKVTGGNEMAVVTGFAMVIAVALAIGLFILTPAILTQVSSAFFPYGPFKALVEGLVRLCIFLLYVYLISKLKDIERVFQYHGAEHKSIFCYEAGEELTPENAKKFSRLHPRCGTSFMFIMIILSIIIFSFVTWENLLLRVLIKIILMPVIVAVGYELLRFSGKHQVGLIRILSLPGIQLQRLTTKEPDISQLEVALAALKAALNPDQALAASQEKNSQGKEEENIFQSEQTDETKGVQIQSNTQADNQEDETI